ncbi:hypothetical protein NL676_029710 [Syzygium grande]|nr:hypothetical protein NL676_029710 [Syzygium grande]
MPPAPHLEELSLARAHPALINMIVGLNKLKSLVIGLLGPLECVPEECWKSLASLESLRIWRCPGLTSLSKEAAAPPPPLVASPASNLERLSIWECDELDICKDESGNLIILDSHGGLHHSLRSVSLYRLPKLASLPRWLLQASNLEDLLIWGCEELDICKDESGNLIILDSHGGLHHSLRSVKINYLPKLASLPEWLLQASNLEDLSILDCITGRSRPFNHFESSKSECPFGGLDAITRPGMRLKSSSPYSPEYLGLPRIGEEVQERWRRGLAQDRSYPPHNSRSLFSFLKIAEERGGQIAATRFAHFPAYLTIPNILSKGIYWVWEDRFIPIRARKTKKNSYSSSNAELVKSGSGSQISSRFLKQNKRNVDLVGNEKMKASTYCYPLYKLGYISGYPRHNTLLRQRNVLLNFRDCCPERGHCMGTYSKPNERSGKFMTLVATKVAPRGLDINDVQLIIQCKPPRDVEPYIHRSGCTGRAGNTGVVVMLYDPRRANVSRIEKESGVKFEHMAAEQPSDPAQAAGVKAAESITQISDS